jgi:polyisoprenoid-binding protein YceI
MSSTPVVSPPSDSHALVPPGSWRISGESRIGFTVRSLGRPVRGRFRSFRGRLVHGAGDGVMASGSVEVASIDTGNAKRDDHLRSADFFDAANHPRITFASRRIIAEGHGYDIPGMLTMKGVSKDVSLVGRRIAPEPGDQRGTIRIVAEATINRHDFGVTAPTRIEVFGLTLSPHVKLRLLVLAVSDDDEPVE